MHMHIVHALTLLFKYTMIVIAPDDSWNDGSYQCVCVHVCVHVHVCAHATEISSTYTCTHVIRHACRYTRYMNLLLNYTVTVIAPDDSWSDGSHHCVCVCVCVCVCACVCIVGVREFVCSKIK